MHKNKKILLSQCRMLRKKHIVKKLDAISDIVILSIY